MEAAINTGNYPEKLKKLNQWVNQEITWNSEKNKYDKKPINSRTGQPAKWSDPNTWASFEDVQALHETNPRAIPAFILAEDNGMVCVDIDNCFDEEGKMVRLAEMLMNTWECYTERSVSGTGIHMLCYGTTPLNGNVTIETGGMELDIEVFTKKRIITLTGDIIKPECSVMTDKQFELNGLADMVKKPESPLVGSAPLAPTFSSSLQPPQELTKLTSALQSVSADDYHDWMRVGMAMRLYGIQNGCENDMWQAFDNWSATTKSGNYDPQKNLKAWSTWNTTGTGNPVTLGSIYHMAKQNGWTFDNRSITSAANGQNGGRPPAPDHPDIAQWFYDDELLHESGHPTIVEHDGMWHEYSEHGWSVVSEKRVLGSIVGYMQNRSDLRPFSKGHVVRSVRDNLASNNYCRTPHMMPAWLDTGESADNWVGFSDGSAVNLVEFAKVWSGKAEPELLVKGKEAYTRDLSPAFFSSSFVGYPGQVQSAKPELFHDYLDRVLPNPESQRMLQQLAGLALTDETRYEVCFALVGSGANGKTVFMDILTALVGRQNVSSVDLHQLDKRFQTFPLAISKLNICGEMPTDVGTTSLHKVEGILKHCITGGDIEVERKGLDKTLAKCRARFVFATNSMPTFVDKSDGIWRRLRVIDFPVTIPVEERDVHLADKIIRDELTGVFHWAMQGLVDIIQNGSVFESKQSQRTKDEHRKGCDKECMFIEEECVVTNDDDAYVPKEMLYTHYKFWCDRGGYKYPMSKVSFLKRLKDLHPDLTESQRTFGDGNRVRCLVGICLEVDSYDMLPVYKNAKL